MEFFEIETVRRVVEFVTGETEESGVAGIKFSVDLGMVDFIPAGIFHFGDFHVNQPLPFSNGFDQVRLVRLELIDKTHLNHFLYL